MYDVNGSEVDLFALRFSGPSYVLPDSFSVVWLDVAEQVDIFTGALLVSLSRCLVLNGCSVSDVVVDVVSRWRNECCWEEFCGP